MSFFFAFFESSAQRCQSSWELGHGINSWCHFGCVTNPPNRVVPQQRTLAISQCLRVSTAHGCLSLSRVAGVSAHLQPRLAVAGVGVGSANSAPAARRLPGRGSRFHGWFSSKHASWEGSCVCRGEKSWSFLRARPHPEEGGWFRLPSRPGPQGAGICQASLEPASYSRARHAFASSTPVWPFCFPLNLPWLSQAISIKIPHLNVSCVYSVIY